MPDLSRIHRAGWKEAVVYQIYPRSFQDSDGDGVGDLPGITQRLDHLADLGVDVVWLSPVYDSPMADNGYDIRNYRRIDDRFGSMADFDRMLEGMHARGLRLMMDLVPNHTSDEHRWFEAARSSTENPYRDYYIWRPPAEDGGPPNNWRSFFGGPAWTYDEATGAYYLHLFHEKQPDLNWDNPDVRHEIYDVMRFWLDKGVAGFRIDVLPFLSKDPALPDLPDDVPMYRFYANGPRIHEYLQEMNREVLRPYDAMTVGEGYGIPPEEALLYVGRERQELQTFFQFDHTNLYRQPDDFYEPRDWTLPELKRVVRTWDDTLAEDGWNAWFFGNHDLPRMVSAFGDDGRYRRRSAKLLLTFLLTMRGTPYIYQGDEIGMTNAPFETLDDFQDVSTHGDVREKIDAGRDLDAVLENHRRLSRDNARTPMQWDATEHAGFTDGEPWLMVNPNHTEINVEAARADEDSVYHTLRRLIRLRRDHPVFVYGTYTDLAPGHERVWAYRRRLEGADVRDVLVLLNWSGEEAALDGLDLGAAEPLAGTVSSPTNELLAPWEARVLQLGG